MSTSALTADPRARALLFSKAPTMLAMPSSSSMATIGKAECSRSEKTVSRQLAVAAWVSLAAAATAAACAGVLAAASVVAASVVAAAASVSAAVEASLAAPAVVLLRLLALTPSPQPLFHRTHSPTTLLLAPTGARRSTSEM